MVVPRFKTLVLLLTVLGSPAWRASGQVEAKKIKVGVLRPQPATITESYNCRIESRRRIEVRTPTAGHVATVDVEEGQAVKQGDLLFRVETTADEGQPVAEGGGEAVAIKAPFDGLVGRLPRQQGSFVLKGEALTTLSDNRMMRAYFQVSESRYLQFTAESEEDRRGLGLELRLASEYKFPHAGELGAMGSEFNPGTGTIAFRADFPNPDGLLRHGQSGVLVIHRVLKDALVIPQRAKFEILDKWYVYVVDEDHVVHQREIVVRAETDDGFVVKKGVGAGDRIVLEGIGQVHDGDKVE